MTIEILKQENCEQQSFANIAAHLGCLPYDELPELSTALKVAALRASLATEWDDDCTDMWFGREDESDTGVAVLKRLEWDSQILGVNCASLTLYLTSGDEPSRKATASLLIHQALVRCRMENIQLVSTKISSNQFTEIHALEDSGFRLMDAEMILRYTDQPKTTPDVQGIDFAVRANEEIPGLASMGQLFRLSRFFADPKISNDKATTLWQSSVRDSCLGHADSFLVAKDGDRPAGFITFKNDLSLEDLGGPSIRSFFHVAVSSESQGRGLGSALLHQATQHSSGFDHILVETQSRNMPALSLYQKCGFRIIGSRFAFHLWLN